jgi:hypothetical protein
MSDLSADDAMWVEWSENWWKKTGNPLHIWRVVAICLKADPPLGIPDWCIPYFADTAFNITLLTGGSDFRGERPPISADQACGLVPQALGLSRQGQKSAFAKIADHARDQQHVNDAEYRGHDAAEVIAAERGITPERSRRRMSKIKNLSRLG